MTDQPAFATCYDTHAEKREMFPLVVIPAMFRLPNMWLQHDADYRQLEPIESWLNGAGLTLAQRSRNDVARFDPESGQTIVLPGNITPNDLAQLHNLARRGKYVGSNAPCDVVLWPAQTLTTGGKCTDWLALIGTVLGAWNVPWRIVTAGDRLDPYRHVWIQAADAAGIWREMDPKGDQRGLPFGEHVNGQLPVRQVWAAVA